MTGNQIKGKGFKGALRYNLEKVEKNLAEVLDHSFVEVSEKMILKEIAMVKVLRPNLQKFFYHTSINFPPAENLSNEVMKQIAQDYLQQNGFTQHQFILFRHYDADHPHLHILVNRIGYDGKVLSDSNDFARSEKVLRELEQKYHLTNVQSSSQASERAITKDELEMMKRTNQPSHKMALQVIIKIVLSTKSKLTCSEFVQALQNKGVNVLFNQASTGYVSGISYAYDRLAFTGSKLGNDFKWTTIKNTIDYEQERDSQIIHAANAQSGASQFNKRTGDSNTLGDQKSLSEHGVKGNTTPKRVGLSSPDDEASPSPRSNARHKSYSASRKNSGNNKGVSEKSHGLNLASLLDGHSHGNTLNVDHQPNLDPEIALGLRRKRKRKKRPG